MKKSFILFIVLGLFASCTRYISIIDKGIEVKKITDISTEEKSIDYNGFKITYQIINDKIAGSIFKSDKCNGSFNNMNHVELSLNDSCSFKITGKLF
jgi:hypothetical protein